jgi:hypothetical protein
MPVPQKMQLAVGRQVLESREFNCTTRQSAVGVEVDTRYAGSVENKVFRVNYAELAGIHSCEAGIQLYMRYPV